MISCLSGNDIFLIPFFKYDKIESLSKNRNKINIKKSIR